MSRYNSIESLLSNLGEKGFIHFFFICFGILLLKTESRHCFYAIDVCVPSLLAPIYSL